MTSIQRRSPSRRDGGRNLGCPGSETDASSAPTPCASRTASASKAVCSSRTATQPPARPPVTQCREELLAHVDCYVWKDGLRPESVVTWTGGCKDRLASGPSVLMLDLAGKHRTEGRGLLRGGKPEGHPRQPAIALQSISDNRRCRALNDHADAGRESLVASNDNASDRAGLPMSEQGIRWRESLRAADPREQGRPRA